LFRLDDTNSRRNVRFATIALCRVGEGRNHIGIVHRDPDQDECLLLHLAFHHRLTNERLDRKRSRPDPKYLGVPPRIPAARLRQVAAMCRMVWRSNARDVPYALSSPNDCFDRETGAFLFGPNRHGLTCASFVLAVFQASGLPLALYETWPIGRAGDREFQEWVVEQLEDAEPPVSAAHLDHVRAEIGIVARFRPEEVAGAALSDSIPAGFADAVAGGERVTQELQSM
jgi:hypothetical protein